MGDHLDSIRSMILPTDLAFLSHMIGILAKVSWAECGARLGVDTVRLPTTPRKGGGGFKYNVVISSVFSANSRSLLLDAREAIPPAATAFGGAN
jgi:hypothetical protein